MAYQNVGTPRFYVNVLEWGAANNGYSYYTENGDEFKKFCTYDGMGFQLLQKTGVKVGILTTEDRDLNRRRAKKLDLNFDFHGAKDKLQIDSGNWEIWLLNSQR